MSIIDKDFKLYQDIILCDATEQEIDEARASYLRAKAIIEYKKLSFRKDTLGHYRNSIVSFLLFLSITVVSNIFHTINFSNIEILLGSICLWIGIYEMLKVIDVIKKWEEM